MTAGMAVVAMLAEHGAASILVFDVDARRMRRARGYAGVQLAASQDALYDAAVRLIDSTLQPLVLNFNIQDDLAVFDLLCGHLHRRSSSSKRLSSARVR